MSQPGRRILLGVILVLLAIAAGALRVPATFGPDGKLTQDEARLALAARGVMERGLPILPSGRLYTRGVLGSYLEAASFKLFGEHDFAARLPSAIAGALLAPATFLLAIALVSPGTLAHPVRDVTVGLAAAAFVALADSLIDASKEAWLPSTFVLLFTLSVWCCCRGFVERRGGWQVAAGGLFILAVLAYEFAVMIPIGLGLTLAIRALRRDWSWWLGRSTLIALLLFAAGLALFVALALGLRAGTLAGPMSEFQAYVTPRARLQGLAYYASSLYSDYAPLAVAGLIGLAALLRRRARAATLVVVFFSVAFMLPAFLIQTKFKDRYALAGLPLLGALAAGATYSLVEALLARLRAPRTCLMVLPTLMVLLIFGVALRDDALAVKRRFRGPTGQSWVQVMQRQPFNQGDLVLAEAPEIVQFYFGPVDFFLHSADYQRYAYGPSDALRLIYTDSVLVRTQGDFERLVEQPNAGRTLWVIGARANLEDYANGIDRKLWPSLVGSAEPVIPAPDGWVILKVRLPRKVAVGAGGVGDHVPG